MPRKKTGDDETPRRRRGAAAAAAVVEPEHGLLLRALLYSPKDLLAGLIAFAASTAIIANALFLQSGPHPAPMFGTAVTPTALLLQNPLPRARPAEADDLQLADQKHSDASLFDPKPVEPPPEAKQTEPRSVVQRQQAEPRASDQRTSDPMATLVRATASAPVPAASNALRPPAPIPVTGSIGGPRRVAAVQRVLTEYGYAQLKPTGTLGPDTKAAIEKFERGRRLPVTGQVSDRLVRELYIATGHAVD